MGVSVNHWGSGDFGDVSQFPTTVPTTKPVVLPSDTLLILDPTRLIAPPPNPLPAVKNAIDKE